MLESLNNLFVWLKNSKFEAEKKMVESLIKFSFINNAYIELDQQSDMITSSLIGEVNGTKHVFGKIEADQILLINNQPYWHIHSDLNKEYHGLGYGREMTLAVVKLVTEAGGKIIRAPIGSSSESDMALKLQESIIKTPGIINKRVVIIVDQDDYLQIKEISEEKYNTLVKTYKERYGADIRRYPFSPEREYSISSRDEDDWWGMNTPQERYEYISVGNTFWASNPNDSKERLPLSLPVYQTYYGKETVKEEKEERSRAAEEYYKEIYKRDDERRKKLYKELERFEQTGQSPYGNSKKEILSYFNQLSKEILERERDPYKAEREKSDRNKYVAEIRQLPVDNDYLEDED